MTRRIHRGIHPRNNFVTLKVVRLIYQDINRYARYEDIYFSFELTVSRILFLEKIVFVIYIFVFLVHIFMPVSTKIFSKIDLRFFKIYFLKNFFQLLASMLLIVITVYDVRFPTKREESKRLPDRYPIPS